MSRCIKPNSNKDSEHLALDTNVWNVNIQVNKVMKLLITKSIEASIDFLIIINVYIKQVTDSLVVIKVETVFHGWAG